MSTFFAPRSATPAAGRPRRRINLSLRLVLALAVGVAGAGALLAGLLPGLIESITGARPEASWYVLRASGLLGYGLLWLTMLAGLGVTSRLTRRWPGPAGNFALHRYTGLLALACAVLHVLALLADQYTAYSLGQVLVPFLSGHYRAAWVGLGQVAFYLLVVVALSFYVRDRLGVHAWRLIHLLSFALFLLALVHGLESGSDSQSLWGRALYWVSGGSVVLGAVYRTVARRRGQRKDGPGARGLIAVGGRAPAPRLGSGTVE